MMNLYPLLNKINKFFKISWIEKRMIIEAFFLTGIMRFSILFIAFNKLAKLTGKYNEESDEYLSAEQIFFRDKIAYIIQLVSKYTPWESKCLVKALATQRMLRRRRISSTIYLGLAKDEKKSLIAHAWVRCGKNIITGGYERYGFTQVAKFANHVGEMKK